MRDLLWRASWQERPGTPVLFIAGVRLVGEGRTPLGRLVQRLSVLPLSRSLPLWLFRRDVLVRPDVSLEDIADAAAAAVQDRFGVPVDVIGESTGGSIALVLASRHPEAVRRLVVVSAAGRMGAAGQHTQRQAVRSLRTGNATAASAAMLATGAGWPRRAPWTRFIGWLVGLGITRTSGRDASNLMEAEDGFDIRHDLERITAPTLLIGGGRDGFYSPDLLAETADAIADADHVSLRWKGHLSAIAEPRVRELIRDFLAREP